LRALGVALLSFLLAVAFIASVHPVSAYVPQEGDTFSYSETITVNNGQGSYAGYSDQTQTTGTEQMNSVNGSDLSASYRYSYQFNDNRGSSTSSSASGAYTWSSSSFTYVNGTDNQAGYSKPVYTWFAMNPSLPVGGTFHALNTELTVLSKSYSLQLPTEGGRYVQAIQARGTGEYQRNDDYGLFAASYTWTEYFDPTTGYIVGYYYVEQDNGQYQGQAGSFTYTDALYVTSTSYSLTAASAPSANAGSGLLGQAPYLVYLVAAVGVLVVVALTAYAVTRSKRGRDSLPEHPYAPGVPPVPPSTPWESRVDLGSKPSQQVVIREVAKVNCRYCGTLIPTTADNCPYCGGPRQ